MDIETFEAGAEPRALDLGRQKTSLRRIYEAEVRLFQQRYGGLETIRQSLGLSRRKICQALLVDPSAWTRWTRDESKVPPHVCRALEWYLLLKDKNPDLVRLFQHQQRSSGGDAALLDRINQLEKEMGDIKSKKAAEMGKFMLLVLGLFVLALFFILIR